MALKGDKKLLVNEDLLLEEQRRAGEIQRIEPGDDAPIRAPKPKALKESVEKIPRKGHYEVPVDPRKRKEKY